MSKDKENICNLDCKDYFEQTENLEVVPYLNNNSDGLQDILNMIEDNTNDLQMKLISDNDDNVVKVNFDK